MLVAVMYEALVCYRSDTVCIALLTVGVRALVVLAQLQARAREHNMTRLAV